jgi:hypothetical protein
VVLIALLAIAIFIGVIALIVKVSGRRFPGDITGDRHREVNYDDPYQGYLFGAKERPSPKQDDGSPQPPGDDFAQWESDHWPGHER